MTAIEIKPHISFTSGLKFPDYHASVSTLTNMEFRLHLPFHHFGSSFHLFQVLQLSSIPYFGISSTSILKRYIPLWRCLETTVKLLDPQYVLHIWTKSLYLFRTML